jgi:hypothetical protein
MLNSDALLPRGSAACAVRAENAGGYGMLVVDSQNLSGDSYIALAAPAVILSSFFTASTQERTAYREDNL